MSHPLMVEAIEELFIPVVVYNNKPVDSAILKEFGERSWNNPVVRFLDSSRSDLVPKREGVWTIEEISSRMIQTLKAAHRPVPEYLNSVSQGQGRGSKVATFAMHCYWEGEAQFGRLEGVQSTLSGWKAGKEVVQVVYDPKKLDYGKLVKKATEFRCASTIFAHDSSQQKIAEKIAPGRVVKANASAKSSRAKDSDQKFYLRKSVYRYLPLTQLQAVKINSALRFGKKKSQIEKFLSPRQLVIAKSIEGLAKQKSSKLSGLIFPESDAQLISYQDKLLQKIK